jgi:hypothetical protein
MIIYLILCSILLTFGVNANIINNDLFSAKFNNNKILLTDNYNKLKISYGYLVEDNTNKETQIDFNHINKDNEYSINYVKTSYMSNLVNIDVINKMFSNDTYDKNDYDKLTKFTNDKLYITININTWKNRSKNNDLILDLDFDNDIIKTDVEYQYISGNYIINFPRMCNSDSYKEEVFIDKIKGSNRLLIHFPYHQHHIIYTYSINLNSHSNLISLFWFIISPIVIICLSYVYYKYRKTHNNSTKDYYNPTKGYYDYNYNNLLCDYKYKYY